MANNSMNDWSTTPGSNTDIAGTDIAVGCAPQDVGVFMRTIMAQIAVAVQGSGGTIPATWNAGLFVGMGVVEVGSGMDFWGTTAPAGYLFAYGQAVSRTTYAALFAVLNTTYGAGDGSTTFNLPDKRGRSSIGKDDMGGTAASRVTAAVSGVTGTTLGAAGGDQALQQHNHSASDSGHTHTDSGHTHIDSGHDHAAPGGASFYTTSGGPLGLATGGNAQAVDLTTAQAYAAIQTSAANIETGMANITVGTAGAGGSQNLPPGIVCNYIIFAGA